MTRTVTTKFIFVIMYSNWKERWVNLPELGVGDTRGCDNRNGSSELAPQVDGVSWMGWWFGGHFRADWPNSSASLRQNRSRERSEFIYFEECKQKPGRLEIKKRHCFFTLCTSPGARRLGLPRLSIYVKIFYW